MKNVRAARRYAAALMSVAEERNAIERIAADLALIEPVLRDVRAFRLFLASPVVSSGKKRAVLTELFGKGICAETASFVNLLVTKQREMVLLEIIEEFQVLREKKLGIVPVDVSTAVELIPVQEEKLRAELEKYTGKSVRLRLSVNGALRGGLRFQVGDTVVDASVRRQLELLHDRFVQGGVR